MTQALITIIAPLAPERLEAARGLIDAMGNPAHEALRTRIEATQGELGLHFMSLHALQSASPDRAYLILEFSADGDGARAIGQVVAAAGHELTQVFALASDWGTGRDVQAYLTRRQVTPGYGWGDPPGLCHIGSPGMTVGRIRREATLGIRLRGLLAEQGPDMTPLQRLDAVRRALARSDPDLATPLSEPLFTPGTLASAIWPAFVSFVQVFLWPAIPPLAAWIIWRGAAAAAHAHRPMEAFIWGALRAGLVGVCVSIALTLMVAVTVYLLFRRQERDDWVSDRSPDPATLTAILERENHFRQNHMVSVTTRKPGFIRAFTLRLAFWAIATLGPRLYRPGYLGDVGTIHFARWITPPGSRDLIFFSNYGGSWEAYLEDFITLAHEGLTAVWSNTVGFPRSSNLFQGGATDGERFKRYARQSMQPTRFWYCAYPGIETDMIRANAAIRGGLAGAMTEDDAANWLGRFGSAIRPQDKLTTSDIQSLLFGGLGFLPASGCCLWTLPTDVVMARRWLRELSPYIAYNDGRRVRDDDRIDAVIQLALSAPGLRALGLAEEGLATFPRAFLDGMGAAHRARILGDTGANSPEYWRWGQSPPHAAVLIYGQDEAAHGVLLGQVQAISARFGARLVTSIPLRFFDRANNAEPFGFADGGSQPVIQGTYKGLKSGGDPLHLVEPGEFILGYPDNRGNIPPGPELPAILDPGNILPIRAASVDRDRNDVNNPRELGRDGSYLVIRHLEQDVAAFDDYCEGEARRLANRLGPPYRVDPDFIAAKLVGRWRNGAPLVRAPYSSAEAGDIISENSFKLGEEDPEALRCPAGAHIRRANPRDSLNPGSADQIAISNRHRILRVGRKYAPAPGEKPGLMFMCLNGDIERQFEFIQQTWVLGNVISLACPVTLPGERDAILGGGPSENSGFTIPTTDGPVRLSPPPRFVTTLGGGYFFLPGRKLITYLTAADHPPRV